MHTEGLLEGLNEAQQQAVQHGAGPLMIIAGAGTGKTTVITRRLAYLVATGAAKPTELLALTFTEKAATEMEERVDRLLPMGYVDLSIGTFHGFCERVLREFGVHIGLSPDFRVMTEVESWLLVRRYIKALNLSYFAPRGNPTKFLQALLDHFSRAKDEGVSAEEYAAHIAGLVPKADEGLSEEDRLERAKWLELRGAYTAYEALLAQEDALDFGGLLLLTKKLLTERPNVLRELQERYAYIVVDEFQDTNRVQYALVKLLAGERQNITIVGDDDQAIYKFRGAALANILQFRDDFPQATKVVLTENYRSHATILNAAYAGITQNNPHRLEAREGLDKRLQAKGEVANGFVRHFHEATQEQEIARVVVEMQRLVGAGVGWGEMAVLTRSNDALQPFLETFDRLGIPFRYSGLNGLYTKGIILDLWALLRVLVDPTDGPAWYRVLTRENGGVPAEDVAAMSALARKHAWPMHVAVERALGEAGVSMEAKNVLAALQEQLKSWRALMARKSAVEMVVKVVQEARFLEEAMAEGEVLAREQFRYLDQFLQRAKRAVREHPAEPDLGAFLADLAAEREAGEAGAVRQDEELGPEAVQLMTVHAAKGLEFRYVFVVSLLEQRFPSVRRSETLPLPPGLVPTDEALDDHVAEERRLFYVAVTRAKEGLYLCSAEDYSGARARKPSRFVAEAGLSVEPRLTEGAEDNPITRTPASVVTPTTITQVQLPKQFSFSQLAAFTNCPLQYKYAHIIKIPTPPRWQMTFGTCMHNAMQRFLEQLKDKQATQQADLFTPAAPATLPPLSTLTELYEQYFTDEWYESAEQRDEVYAFGRSALLDLYGKMEKVTPRPAYLEQGFTLKLDDILIKGRIDRIDAVEGGYEIIDYKTGQPKDKLDADAKRQLTLYAIAAEECFEPPLKVVRCTYHYFEGNVQASFTPTDQEKEKLKLQIRETIAAMKTSSFVATPNARLCQYCDFKLICPFAIL